MLTKEQANDLRMKAYRREEVTLADLREAVIFLRQGRESAKPVEKKKKATKIEMSADELLGL